MAQVPTSSLLECFEEQVRKSPNKIAVTDPNHQLTYDDLNKRAEAISQKLLKSSVPNAYVAVLLPQGVEFISSIFGIFKAGRTAAPLSIDHSRTQIRDILLELQEPLILTTKLYIGKLPVRYSKILLVSDEEMSIDANQSINYKCEQKPNPVAFCIFTSGSTGKPKGVLHSDSSIVQMVFSTWHLNEVRDTDRILGYSSPAFILSFREYFALLLCGGSIHVPPAEFRQDIDKLLEFIDQHRITLLAVPSAMANKVMSRNIPSLRWLLFGGEKQTTEIPRSLNFQINYAYGSTETLFMTWNPAPGSTTPHNGKPERGVEVFILDSKLAKVPNGDIGEIGVVSPTLALGYLNNPKLTAERFILNPFNPEQRLFRTGDLGYINSDGNLVVVGRSDFQIKIMGNRIELAQVEVALALHPGIKEAAVIPVLKRESTTLTAFCVPSGASLPDYDEMYIFLEDYLPRYGIPTHVVPIAQLPMTTSGKVNRVALKEIDVSRVVEPPVTPTEIEVAKIWSGVLEIPFDEIGLTDTFFGLGGNSFQLAHAVTKFQQAPFFLNLRTIHLIRVPRLDKFAELVNRFKMGHFEFLDEGNQNDYEADASLPIDFPSHINPSKSELKITFNRVLLTGSTGYVGVNFMTELLKREEDFNVTCIIRAKSNEEAAKRLILALNKFDLDSAAATDRRLVCIAGDVSKPFLGLGSEEYAKLCQEIDAVYHFAAEVHWLKYYSELRDSNILGTKRILKFSAEGNLKFLHYMSTLGVVGSSYPGSNVLETPDPLWTVNEQKNLDTGYFQTKRIAEKLVWAAIERGLPAIVYRLGEVGCHSKLNVVNKTDFLARLFIACKEIGFHPLMTLQIPYGTVDFTCDSILHIGQNTSKYAGQCFHIFEAQIPILDGFELINKLQGLSKQEWTEKLAHAIESISDLKQQEEYSILLQLFHNQSNSTLFSNNFSNQNTRNAILGSDIAFNCNEGWKHYLDLLFGQ